MGDPPLPVPKLGCLADVPHALPYQGSKRLLAPAIVALIPADATRLVEPFAGSAAVSIAARHGSFVRSTEISDVDEPLMHLWRRILDEPALLADQYEDLWHEQLADPKSFYALVRERFNLRREPQLLLYLLARCVKAAVRYSTNGRFNQSADNRRLGARPAVMRERIAATSTTLAGTTVRSGDFAGPLLTAAPESVVYLDPPYQGVSHARDHRYSAGLRRFDFEGVLRDAVGGGTSFLVSYDVIRADGRYGAALASDLGLLHLHVEAGRSTQATLQGIARSTTESLYLSPALVDRLGGERGVRERVVTRQATIPVQ